MAVKLRELGHFEWRDEESDERVTVTSNMRVVMKSEVLIGAGDEKVKYSGEWSDDKRHGKGTQLWKNGTRYDGYFIED